MQLLQLSHVMVEIRQLSGLSITDFCCALNVNEESYLNWETAGSKDSPSLKMVFKALKVLVNSPRDTEKASRVRHQLSQAEAIVVTVSESQSDIHEDGITDEQRLSLQAAADLIKSARS